MSTDTASMSVSAPQDIPELCGRLRALLSMANKARPSDWDDQVSKAVGLLAVDYGTQSDSMIAFRELALITLAAQKGSKTAKSRALGTGRWKDEPPPALAMTDLGPDEAKAALKGLSRVRSAWVLGYAFSGLATKDKSIRGELTTWALMNAESLSALIESWTTGIASIPESESSRLVPELVAMFLKVPSARALPVGSHFLEATARLVRGCAGENMADKGAAAAKERQRIQSALLDILDFGVSQEPKFCLQPSFGTALTEIAAITKSLPKAAARRMNSILGRAANTLSLLLSVADENARVVIAEMSRSLAQQFSSYRTYLDGLVSVDRSLVALASEPAGLRGANKPGANLEDALTSLLPDIDDLALRLADDASVAQVARKAAEVARASHVHSLGSEGETLPFDPLRHALTTGSPGQVGIVKIKRRGLVKRREDGSERVLLKAIVEPKD